MSARCLVNMVPFWWGGRVQCMFSQEHATKSWSGGESCQTPPRQPPALSKTLAECTLEMLCSHDTAGPILHHSSCPCTCVEREGREVIWTLFQPVHIPRTLLVWRRWFYRHTGCLGWAAPLHWSESGVTVLYASLLLHENMAHYSMPHATVHRTAWPIHEIVTWGEEEMTWTIAEERGERGVLQRGKWILCSEVVTV